MTVDLVFLQMLLSGVTLFVAVVMACFAERKAAICAHFRQVLANEFVDTTFEMDAYTEKKLVFARGPAVVRKAAFDPILGIKAPQGSYVLERTVEMLQWVEHFTRMPGDEERYQATYELQWSKKPIYSSGFLNKLYYFNPKAMALETKKFFADGC